MTIFEPARPLWTSRILSLLRIAAALVYIEHGTQKLFGFPAGNGAHHLMLMSQTGLAGIIETFGGLCLLLGLFTRVAAFFTSGEMAVAYFQVHNHRGLFPIQNGGDDAILLCFIFFYFIFAGGGLWSVDAVIATARRNRVQRVGPPAS